MEFRILGPLEVVVDDQSVDLGGFKQRAVLVILLLNAGRVVSSGRLIDELWSGWPPKTALGTLQTYVSRLRDALEPERPRAAAPKVLVTRLTGYLLQATPDQIDAAQFEHLLKEGSAALEAGDPGLALTKLSAGLSLWRGPALEDFADMVFAQGEIVRLEELHLVAVETRIEADLALGRHAEVVGELEALIKECPHRERLRAQLMLALYRSGRQVDALRVYREARALFIEELGVDPSTTLQRLEQDILLHKPELDWAPPEPPGRPTPIGRLPHVEPEPGGWHAAPAAHSVFVGRGAELDELRRALADARSGRGRLVLVVGEPGSGKSRIARALSDEMQGLGAEVLWGQASKEQQAPAFWPWIQVVRAWTANRSAKQLRDQLGPDAAVITQLVPELGERLPGLPEPTRLEPAQARLRLFAALAKLLTQSAAEQTLVVVLDDLHRTDEPSLLFLQFLARKLTSARLLVLGTYRNAATTAQQPLPRILTELTFEPATCHIQFERLREPVALREITSQRPPVGDPSSTKATHLSPYGRAIWELPDEASDLFQLPPSLADFTGRQTQVEQVRGMLVGDIGQQPAAVVISAIAGKGGVGKTALAIHVAHQVRHRFPDGQLYMNLRGTDAQPLKPTDVLAEFLRTLGVQPMAIPDRLEARARLYRARLSDRRVLVVLDNAADEAQVRPLLPGSAGCAVVVTSRRRLAGLEGATTVDLDVMDPDQAIELLGKVAGPQRVAAEPEAAAELVHLCGYLPLAVRIAGARLAAKPHWRLAGYAARLQDERRRLGELRVGDLEVRASFMLSDQALSPDERHAFRLLGTLNGPDFAAWVAAALLDCGLQAAEDLIERLVDARLVEATPEDPTGCIRYRFHDLLRVFARERLREEEPVTAQQAALERAFAAYLALAQRASACLGRDDHRIDPNIHSHLKPVNDSGLAAMVERDPLAWFRAEQENLIAAVGQVYGAGLWELTWELAGSLSAFLEYRTLWSALEYINGLALDATRKAANRQAEAYILRRIGIIYRFYREEGRGKESMACFERGLALFAEFGDQRGTAYALLGRGATYRSRGHFDDALVDFDRCLSLFRELKEELGEAAALREIGVIAFHRGRFDDATACLTQALTVFQRCGAHLPVALTLGHLGLVYRDRGRFDDAIASTEQSLAVLRELGYRLGEALALRSLGEIYRRLGRLDEALDRLGDCLSIFRELGDRSGEAWTLRSLGDLYRDQGRLDEALNCFDRCLPVFRELGARRAEADALHSLGELYQALGRREDAMSSFDQSLIVFRELGLPLKEARTLMSIGTLLAAHGDQTAAHAAWHQAWIIFRDLGVPEAAQVQAYLQ
jgi:DNA-binding SARP family transcriptional activator/Cdc6-like AAA superfamily ATPase